MSHSAAHNLAALPESARLEVLGGLSPEELERLQYEWPFWARPDQLPPAGDWRTWLLLGGRGSGKTRSSAEWIRSEVESGRRKQLGIVGPTADTLRRDVVQGPSGILATAAPWFQPSYEPSSRRVVWPNGAVAHLFSAEEPDRLRGPNLDGAWVDELTSMPLGADVWDMLQMCLRVPGPLGDAPRVVISTTPKPQPTLKAIIAAASTVITRAKTLDNTANLDASTVRYLMEKYGGTTLGRQELDAELLDDVEGALWNRQLLDETRVSLAPQLRRIVVAVDPAGGSSKASDETGIIVAGVSQEGHGYVLADLSGRFTPIAWASKVVTAYHGHAADRIVAEANFGGQMVEATIRQVDRNVPVKLVHASRGKAVRAEPVVALYEQRRIHHVGIHTGLEDQLCQWAPADGGPSPDRLDALVWAISELMVEKQGQAARFLNLHWIGR